MFGLLKRKKKLELNYKSRTISVMHLNKIKTQLEKELSLDIRKGEFERSCAEYDIRCLKETIEYLEQ